MPSPARRIAAFPCAPVDFERLQSRLEAQTVEPTIFVARHMTWAPGLAHVERYEKRPAVRAGFDECWLFRDRIGLRSGRLALRALLSGATRFRVVGAAEEDARWSRTRLVLEIGRAVIMRPVRRMIDAVIALIARSLWLDRAAFRIFALLNVRRPRSSQYRADEVHFFVGSLGLGGTQRQLLSLVRSLTQRGYRCKVWVLSNRDFFSAQLEEAGGTSESIFESSRYGRVLFTLLQLFRYQSYTISAIALARRLRRERPAVLQCLLDTTNVSGALAGRIARVPVVVAGLRSVHPEDRGEIATPFQRYCYRLLRPGLVDALIANSRSGRDTFLRRMPRFPADKIRVVHNGIDVRSGPPAIAAAEETPLIVWAGRIAPEKRLDCLLHACKELARRGVRFRLQIVGDGRDKNAMHALSRELGLEDRVRFIPSQTDIAPFLAAAAMVVLTSDLEGFPNILLEAQAAGRPVVSTRAGGVEELVEDGVTGFLVDRGDAIALADRMAEILGNGALGERVGIQAAAQVRERFGSARMASETLAIYEELAAAKGASLRAKIT